MKLLALVPFKDGMKYLPGLFRNITPHVDGIIGLNDKSNDRSREFFSRQKKVVDVIDTRRDTTWWDDGMNHRMLADASLKHGADWVIGIDVDERVEKNFRRMAEAEIRRGFMAYSIRVLDIWDSPDTYRTDGVWGHKSKVVLFKPRYDAIYDMRVLHGQWAPMNSAHNGSFEQADIIIYHLLMTQRKDRLSRLVKYKQLDPTNAWQGSGYDYLTDETGLKLEKIKPGREYVT